MVAHTCNTNTWEVAAEDYGIEFTVGFVVSSRSAWTKSENLFQPNRKEKIKERGVTQVGDEVGEGGRNSDNPARQGALS